MTVSHIEYLTVEYTVLCKVRACEIMFGPRVEPLCCLLVNVHVKNGHLCIAGQQD